MSWTKLFPLRTMLARGKDDRQLPRVDRACAAPARVKPGSGWRSQKAVGCGRDRGLEYYWGGTSINTLSWVQKSARGDIGERLQHGRKKLGGGTAQTLATATITIGNPER